MAWRALYRVLLEASEDSDVHGQVLRPWLLAHPEEIDELRRLADRASPSVPLPFEDSFALHALSCVHDALLLGFQHGVHDTWAGPRISPAQHVDFMTALGFTSLQPVPFAPFFHEIVAVTLASRRAAPPKVQRTAWPGFMLGPLMFSRAGVEVEAGTDHLDADVASTSTLYWTHRRRNRPRANQADGWGHNSSWATPFRCDYLTSDAYVFNAEGRSDLNAPVAERGDAVDELTVAQRIELLTHRCFVKTRDAGQDDRYPYNDRLQVRR